MNRIKELPKSSSHLLSSTQLVTSIYSVIKELVENSLDSSPKNIDIKLVDYGLEKIEVKDNGSGIHKDDICFVAKPHSTSKITSHLDLDKLETYGFRGEALAALCTVSDLTISTKTVDDEFGISYTFDHKGEVLTSKPCSLNQGTVVTALNLFKNVPVRKQLYRSSKVKKEDLKKIENMLIAFGCIQTGLRFSLYHNQNLIWQKLTARSTSEGLEQVFGSSVFEHLKNYSYTDDETQISIELFLPKNNSSKICSQSSPSRSIVAVNKRPVRMKILDKLIKEHYSKTLESGSSSCYPICYITINLPTSEVDINFEPNKTVVALQNMDLVCQHFSEALNRFYSQDLNVEINSDINKSILIQKNDTNLNKKINPKDMTTIEDMPTVQMEQHGLEPDILTVALEDGVNYSANKTNSENVALTDSGKYSSDKTNSENVISKDLMQKSQQSIVLKQRCESLSLREKQMTSKKLSRKNDSLTSSTKRVKTSSNIVIPSTPMEKHIQTLDNYFSSKENSIDPSTAPNIATDIPVAVTLQRNSVDSNMNAEFICNRTLSVISKKTNSEQPDSMRRHSSDSCIVNSCNDINETSSILDVAIDKWSRGIHPVGNVQPVVILKPKNTENDKCLKENISLENADNKRESYGKFQNQRKITPYDIFCRRNRLEVASLNSNMNNQQIAQILTKKWDQLSPEEKASYKNFNDKDYPKNIKKQTEFPVNTGQNLDKEKTALVKCKKSRKMKVKYLEKDISFNIEMVNTISHESSLKVENMKVINSISAGMWICFQENKLYLLNSFRLQEVVVYQRLLETFQLEADILDSPYVIPTSSLDNDDIDIILKMNLTRGDGNEILISDERLTANGFKLQFFKNEHEIHVEATGITKAVAGYGVQDLKEILSLIKANSVYKNLSDCRPSKVVLYLQGEAMRITRQYSVSKKLEDIEDLLKQQKSSNSCFHSEPFLHVLFTIPADSNL